MNNIYISTVNKVLTEREERQQTVKNLVYGLWETLKIPNEIRDSLYVELNYYPDKMAYILSIHEKPKPTYYKGTGETQSIPSQPLQHTATFLSEFVVLEDGIDLLSTIKPMLRRIVRFMPDLAERYPEWCI